MDHVEIWDKAKALLREELANVSYTTWIDQPLKPVYVVDDKLALEVISEFTERTIRARYLSMITEAVSQVAGREMSVELMSVKERIAWQESQKKEEQAPLQGVNTFNPKSTFDTFVVGSSNRFAHAASLAVAEAPGMAYNPLFLYSSVGLGKSHLLQAIAQEVLDRNPSAVVEYVTTEEFSNQYVYALQHNSLPSFRNRIRNVDVLLVDDIQFLGAKTGFQEEFFHTFNALYNAHKQMVMASDRPPQEINGLEKRLVSRFEWGLTADIQPPDLETRIAIIRKKQECQEIKLSDEVINYLAARLKSNVRRLEGALTNLILHAKFEKQEVTIDVAERVLAGILNEESSSQLTVEQIQRVVAEHYDIRFADMTSKRRPASIAMPRQVAMYFSRKLTNLSYPDIGEQFGKNHATVLHAVTAVEERMASNQNFRHDLSTIERKLKA